MVLSKRERIIAIVTLAIILMLVLDRYAVTPLMEMNDNIRIEKIDGEDGIQVRFDIQEKPTIRDIIIKGNSSAYDTEEIEEVLTISSGAILNIFSVKNNINRIKGLYFEKNYHNVEVTYETPEHGKGQIDLVFHIS